MCAEDDDAGDEGHDGDTSGGAEPFDIPHAGGEDKTGMPGEPEPGIHPPRPPRRGGTTAFKLQASPVLNLLCCLDRPGCCSSGCEDASLEGTGLSASLAVELHLLRQLQGEVCRSIIHAACNMKLSSTTNFILKLISLEVLYVCCSDASALLDMGHRGTADSCGSSLSQSQSN